MSEREQKERERSTEILQRLRRIMPVKRLCTETISFSKSAFCQKNKKDHDP